MTEKYTVKIKKEILNLLKEKAKKENKKLSVAFTEAIELYKKEKEKK